jgi:hypothetical protein
MKSFSFVAAWIFILLSTFALPSPARGTGADWDRLGLTVADPRSETRVTRPGQRVDGPVEELRITGLPSSPTRLRVDLDGDPVAEARVEGGEDWVVRVRLPRRRRHRVRVFEVLAAEDDPGRVAWIEERGRWLFVAGRPGPVEEAELHTAATVAAGWQIAEDGGAGLTGDDPLEATGELRARIAGAGWRIVARADFARAEPTFDLGTGGADLGSFRLEGTAGPLAVVAGDQDFGRGLGGLGDGLAVGSFYRRGVSVRLDPGDAGVGLAAFVAATEPDAGWSAEVGVGEPRRRVTGAIVSRHPAASGPGPELAVSAVYLTGEGAPDRGDGVAGDPLPSAGEVWGVAAAGRFLDRRLEVQGEVAESRFDADGDAAAEPRRDRAFAVGARFETRRREPAGRAFDWRTGVERRRVGTFFRTLANPALGADQDTHRGFVGVAWRRFDLELRWRRDRDNVADLELLPSSESDSATLVATYRRPGGAAGGGWLAPGTVTLAVYRAEDETLATPDPAFELDRTLRSFHLAASGGAWSFDYSRDRYRDLAFSGIDASSELADLRVRFGHRRWSLEPSAQWSRFEGAGPAVETVLLRLSAFRQLIPEVLTGSLRADLLRRSTAGGDERRTVALGADLSWRLAAPRDHLPGVDLWLRGHYTDEEAEGAAPPLRATASRLLLGARLSWSRWW